MYSLNWIPVHLRSTQTIGTINLASSRTCDIRKEKMLNKSQYGTGEPGVLRQKSYSVLKIEVITEY